MAAISPSRLGGMGPGASPSLAAAPGRNDGAVGLAQKGQLRRSLRACMAEGILAEVVGACAGGAILTAWAIYLDAGTLLTGTLVALSQLAQLFQFPAAWITSALGHRRACIVLVAASRQAMLPLAALPFLPVSNEVRQTILLVVAGLSAVLGTLGNNAWVSWMSDLVPKRVRGRYFGRRTAWCTLGGALASAAAGALLDLAKQHQRTGMALASLQILGAVTGLVTTWLMLRQHAPRSERRTVPLAWRWVAAPFRDASVRGLMLYLVVWNAAVGVAGSFFVLHSLRNLRMSYTLVALHATAVAAVRMLAAPVWGRLLDRMGARPVLIACSFTIASIPFIWLFPTANFLWPLVADAVLAGVLWSGHALAIFNLPLAITPRAERPFYLAAFATLTGLSFTLATLAGGLVAEALPDRFLLAGHELTDLQVVFVASGFLRFGAAFVGLRIQEPASQTVSALWGALRPRPLEAGSAVRRLPEVANDNARTVEAPGRAAASAGKHRS
ncbi:MAG: MFS transporter [Myxococcales bacterium]